MLLKKNWFIFLRLSKKAEFLKEKKLKQNKTRWNKKDLDCVATNQKILNNGSKSLFGEGNTISINYCSWWNFDGYLS